jgi:hypothetical protein
MSNGMQGAVAVATLALAIVSAVGLAATGPAVEDHVALAAASATHQLLP